MRPEAQTSNQIWILADYLEFGSLHHPSSCTSSHRTAAPAATLMVPSIKKPSKCAISSFSFSYLFLLYTLPGEGSQAPGQHFSHFSNLLYRRLTGSRPGDTILKPPTKNKGFLPFLGVWEFDSRASRPATLSTGYPQLEGYR